MIILERFPRPSSNHVTSYFNGFIYTRAVCNLADQIHEQEVAAISSLDLDYGRKLLGDQEHSAIITNLPKGDKNFRTTVKR